MSLQKIQVELEVIREIHQDVEDGEFNLNERVWKDFKDWELEPKYLYKKPASRAKKMRLQKQKSQSVKSVSDKSEKQDDDDDKNSQGSGSKPGHKRNAS